MQSNASGIVTRLHLTFEQTCLGGTPPTVGFFGKGTGELWIIDGTTPSMPGRPSAAQHNIATDSASTSRRLLGVISL